MNRRSWLPLLPIVLTSAVVGSMWLTRGHNWGDDFAAYILQAEAIADGRLSEFVQRSTFTIEQSSWRFGPVIVPWGLPVLLAPVHAIFGTSLLAYKLVLTLCYAAFLFPFFLLARLWLTEPEALVITSFMAFNPGMLRAQNEILSDLPFLLWSTLALWLIARPCRQKQAAGAGVVSQAAIGLAIFLAAFTRPNGMLLIVPLLVSQWAAFRTRPRGQQFAPTEVIQSVVPFLVLVLLYGLQSVLLPSSAVGLRDQWQDLSIQTVLPNLGYYFLLPGDFLTSLGHGGYALYGLLLIGLGLAFAQEELDGASAGILLYCAATVGLFVMFPFRQGPRYIFPVLPVFFLLAFTGMKRTTSRLRPDRERLGRAVVMAFWAALAVLSLAVSLRTARENLLGGRREPTGPYSDAASPMLSFVQNATPPDSIIIFFKPRAMLLLTDRDAFLTTECDDLPLGDYAVIVKDGGTYNQISPSRIGTCNPGVLLTRIYGKGDFEVFQIDAAE